MTKNDGNQFYHSHSYTGWDGGMVHGDAAARSPAGFAGARGAELELGRAHPQPFGLTETDKGEEMGREVRGAPINLYAKKK